MRTTGIFGTCSFAVDEFCVPELLFEVVSDVLTLRLKNCREISARKDVVVHKVVHVPGAGSLATSLFVKALLSSSTMILTYINAINKHCFYKIYRVSKSYEYY